MDGFGETPPMVVSSLRGVAWLDSAPPRPLGALDEGDRRNRVLICRRPERLLVFAPTEAVLWS